MSDEEKEYESFGEMVTDLKERSKNGDAKAQGQLDSLQKRLKNDVEKLKKSNQKLGKVVEKAIYDE